MYACEYVHEEKLGLVFTQCRKQFFTFIPIIKKNQGARQTIIEDHFVVLSQILSHAYCDISQV